MANVPLKARALILLSKGYESAHKGKPFILDGDVARAAQVEAEKFVLNIGHLGCREPVVHPPTYE